MISHDNTIVDFFKSKPGEAVPQVYGILMENELAFSKGTSDDEPPTP